MGLKFVDNLKRAFTVLKDGRFRDALLNAFQVVSKLRHILVLLQERSGDPTVSKVTTGVDGGLFRVADILVTMLGFFGVTAPVKQLSDQSLDEALKELEEMLEKTKKVELPENVVPQE